MGLPTESSRNKGRESAIETLIDMDEAGVAYRVSRTMSQGLLSSLHSRFNRITDSSLFDAAKALSVYEIPASSDAVLTHLRHDNSPSGGSADDAISTPKSKSETSPSIVTSKPKSESAPLSKRGWEERVLRHHDKIVKTKNAAAAAASPSLLTSKEATAASAPPASAGPPPSTPVAEHPSKLPPREHASSAPSPASASSPPSARAPSGVDLPRDRTDRPTPPRAVVPPPPLVSALRQMFGSGSSRDARDGVSSRDDDGANADYHDDNDDGHDADPDAASALPSLLQAVLHHSAFGAPSLDGAGNERGSYRGTSRTGRTAVAPSAKKDWKSLFDGGEEDGSLVGKNAIGDGAVGGTGDAMPAHGRDGAAGEASREERDVDVDADGEIDAEHVDDPRHPVPHSTTAAAANLEAILGNVCRNHIGSLDHRASGSDHDRIRGLLIASLSIMTTCLLSEEDLEGGRLRLGKAGRQDPPGGSSGGPPRSGPLSSSTATLADGTGDASQLLQVGGILSVLRGSLPASIDGLRGNEEVEKLFLKESLLDYFAEASSTYEERIEIQKESLLGGRRSGSGCGGEATTTTTTDTPMETDSKGKKKMGMLANLLTPKEGGGRTTTTTTTRGRDSLNITATSALSELLSSTSDADTQLADDIANATSILLGNIANLVGEEDDDDDDGLGSGNGDDSGDDQDDDVEHGREQDQEGDRASLEQHVEDGERSNANNIENTDESERQNYGNDRDQGESDNRVEDSSENDGGDDDETMLLQRALALSLASTISAGASDGSNSEHGDDAAKTDALSVKEEDEVIGVVDKDEKSSKKSSEQPSSPRDHNGEENAVDLPPLPELPSRNILPKSSLYDITVLESPDREDSVRKPSIFDPSAFPTYGNLPASHVLIHLLRSMLGLLQDPSYNALTATDSTPKSGSRANEARSSFFTPTSAPMSVLKNTSRRFEAQGATTAPKRNDQNEKSFAPDSATASLLIASLHLSNHLRDSSLTVLRNLLADIDVSVEITTDDGDDAEQSIQIANSAESEDLLPEKDDPASGMATAEALEAKGLKRKAAAAAQMASLRHSTKQKLVGQWKDRVTLYSLCCYLTMQCLRSFVGKCTQQGLDHECDRDEFIRLSAKTRSGLSSILSSFHSVSASISYQNIQDSMENFFTGDSVAIDKLGDSFLVKPLCNESLLLWGASIPLLYPDHTERVNLLHELIRNNMASDTSEILFPASRFQVESCNWNESELQRCKLEILCWRLRISDMLGHFIAQPIIVTESNDQTSRTLFENRRQVPNNSLSTFSLLGPFVERHKTLMQFASETDANPAKFYLALCQRAIHNLLLWNDLSLSSNDANDHDISGGGVGTAQAGTWGEGTMQLESNPTKFHFDSTKCSDSIAIVPSGSSAVGATANQRATKVWGTVLSTKCFTPKSGVHRWAVKLDKCERGHVFVGVATARASVKTYVGGDKNGWGLIGTQALWHDRNKIRGDYGAPFRTGAVVIATLDTNAGTLSFGLWKDASPPSDGASGPLSPSQGMSLISSPRKTSSHGAGGAVIEDWGVAFEGLPLDVKLYPAVGLYQRDDRASLYTVSNSDLLGSGKSATPPLVSSGSFYYPSAKDGVEVEPSVISGVRAWNRSLCADGIAFTSEALIQTIKILTCESTSSIESSILMTRLLPSLASSICLIPSCIPNLSAKYAMELIPLATRCAKLIDRKFSDNDDCKLGLDMKEGLWALRAKSSSSETDSQSCANLKEYEVQLSRKSLEMHDSVYTIFKGQGKSKSSRSPHETLSCTAATCGTHIQIIEEWKSTDLHHSSNSPIIIDGRLNLDGTKLEGFYFCKEDGSTGQISGNLKTPGKEVPPPNYRKQLVETEALLCQAVGHLALMLSSKTVLADVDEDDENPEDSLAIIKSQDSFQQLLQASRILSCGRIDRKGQISRRIADSIRERCRAINSPDHVVIVEEWENLIYRSLHTTSDDCSTLGSVEAMEAEHTVQHYSLSSENEGSFSRLCADEYKTSRIKVAASILYHIGSNEEKSTNHEWVVLSWRASLQIMETGIREALLNLKPGLQRKEACLERCRLSNMISAFLLEFPTLSASSSPNSIADEIAFIYKSIRALKDLELIKLQMDSRSEKSTLRFLGFRSLELLLQTEDSVEGMSNQIAIETAMTSFPRLLRQSPPSFIANDHLPNHELNNQHYSSIIAGCAPSIHRCLTSSVHSIYECLGAILSSTLLQDLQTNQKTIFSMSSFMFGLLANYFTVLHQCDFKSVLKNIVPSLAKFIGYCREDALKEEDSLLTVEEGLLCALNRNTARRLLHACTSVILSTCAQLSSQEETPVSASLAKALLHLVLQELSATIPIAGKVFMHREKKKLLNTIRSDWDECKKYLEGRTSQPGPNTDEEFTLSTPILTALIGHISHLSMKSSSSQSSEFVPSESLAPCRYLNQLLNILQVVSQSGLFLKSVRDQSNDWINALLPPKEFPLVTEDQEATVFNTNSLPLRYRLRILRLLRPLILSIESNPDVVRQILELSGAMLNAIDSEVSTSSASIAKDAVSLLRYLYAFSGEGSHSWRNCIHQVVEDIQMDNLQIPSVSKFAGVYSFLGGSPGILVNGSFVIVEPDVASTMSSSLNSSSGKSRSSAGGSSSVITNSAGSGVESVIAGLCRHHAIAGILSGVDYRYGVCEVVTTEKFRSQLILPPTVPSSVNFSGRAMTIRAVRVNASDLTAVDELPLHIDKKLSTRYVFLPLVDPLKLLISSMKSSQLDSDMQDVDKVANLSGKEDAILSEQSVEDTLICAMGLRSCVILVSDPEMLKSFITENEDETIFALALQMATLHTSSNDSKLPDSLSSLPAHEARLHHLLSMRSMVNSRRCTLAATTIESLKDAFDKEQPDAEISGSSSSSSRRGLLRSPPSGNESSFTSALDRTTANSSSNSNRREEEESVSTAETTGHNQSLNTSSERHEEEEDESDTAAAHLREAAIAQMAELGLPRQWAELALRRTGGTNIEAAVHFCLERGGDMERLLAEDLERRGSGANLPTGRRRGFGVNSRADASNLIRQLVEMGFPRRWCAEALAACRNNVDEALTWILTNGERLSAEDEGAEEDEEDDDEDMGEVEENDDDEVDGEEDDEDDEDEDSSGERTTQNENSVNYSRATSQKQKEKIGTTTRVGWSGSICPVRFVSGKSSIDSETLEITGLPNGGFSSVGTKGVLLTSGKWYYEAEIKTAGCLQIGWADASFAGHCQADRGDGCGDGPSSWAFDGWRRYRWHSTATEWGCRWSEGDVVGCFVDMDSMTVSFTLNGKGEEIGMGIAFSGEGFRPCSGVYACVSFNRREKIRLILGGEGTEPFKYPPPSGYRGVGEAILEAVEERNIILEEENILKLPTKNADNNRQKKYVCDFSDGEHGHELFAWQHRYHGSDASVHLGASRSSLRGLAGSVHKSSKGGVPLKNKNSTAEDISGRLIKVLEKLNTSPIVEFETNTFESRVEFLKEGYSRLLASIDDELKATLASLCILYSRKLVIHMIISQGVKFSPTLFLPNPLKISENIDSTEDISRSLWQVIENCASLHSSGWVGEAGAMAVAAEALGLGISSFDHNDSGPAPSGMCTSSDEFDQVVITCGGITQFLNSAILPRSDVIKDCCLSPTCMVFAACAESAIGSDAGGSLSFLRAGLQNAVVKSASFRHVVLAAVRKAVRILAAIEYTSEEKLVDDEDSDVVASSNNDRKQTNIDSSSDFPPDARLTSFLTGLLLSEQVSHQLPEIENIALRSSLFEGWCVGLLSASSPWRMVCSLTAAGILNLCPAALYHATSRVSIIAKYFSRLENTVARRVWAERAATPVCSRYCQAMIELLSSVKRSLRLDPNAAKHFIQDSIKVDAATPLSLESYVNKKKSDLFPCCESWEWSQGWVSNNFGWEILTGSVEIMEVEWKQPPRSVVRTLMDGGEGPPLLREGCLVMRGPDWDKRVNANNEDGRDLYEKEKLSKDAEKISGGDQARNSPQPEAERGSDGIDNERDSGGTDSAPEQDAIEVSADASLTIPSTNPAPMEVSLLRKKKKKTAGAKLPLGTVLSIESWNGIPGVARRVRWHLTGQEGVYRYGGDGGHFDIIHVETNDKKTRVKKRYPNPESAEQCAARYGFGRGRTCNVLLRLRRCPEREVFARDADLDCIGVLEWPDFGAGILVECTLHTDGAITIREKAVLYGSKDSGWEARFGQPSFVPGSVFVISPTQAPTSTYQDDANTAYDELLGSDSFLVKSLRNREDGGGRLRVTSEMRLFRSKAGSITRQEGGINIDSFFASTSSPPPPICFDSNFHAPSISLSKDKRTITCTTSDGRGTAFGNVGFTKGVHYWEVKLEKAEIGSVFIGVAEKPGSPSGSSQGSSYGFESQPRLNRWLGWGFVNFRATYTAGAERVYGAHCHAGDTVGVLLDCDSGRISYFFDGVLYGEHILNDLGCAFENVSPFGFNADGCGSGGAGQGAPSGVDGGRSGRYPSNGAVRPRALWPVIGLRHPGDRVTMSSKWMTSHGVDGITVLRNALAVDEVFCNYEGNRNASYSSKHVSTAESNAKLPKWFIEESFFEYNRWKSDKWLRSSTRGSGPYKLSSYGLDVDLDTSPFACAAACAAIGLPTAFLPGDLVDVKRSAGRILELQEKALVLGTYQGRLFYRLISQKSEGGSLMEGGGRAWFWDESEAVEGGLHIIGNGRGLSVELPKLSRFKPVTGGLKIVYPGGAVVRSDLEIFDGSENIGKIPHGTVIPPDNIIEKRLNSCGVVRYLVDYEPVGRGWISSRIRGGKEELIVETLPSSSNGDDPLSRLLYATPEDSATVWYKNYLQARRNERHTNDLESVESKRNAFLETFNVKDIDEFSDLLATGKIRRCNELESDSLIAAAYGRIADVLPHCDEIECSFADCALIMTNLSLPQSSKNRELEDLFKTIDSAAFEVASESLLHLSDKLPSPKSLMARIAMLRALNRRARLGLPWLPVRPSQESSAIFGGLAGFGPSLERAGRSFDKNFQSTWAQVPSISSRLRKCRGLLFCSVKRSFVDSVMDTTATPTPLSHDEYELPREVRTVRVNRLKARRAIASDDSGLKRKHSVFSQLQREMRGWSGATLRRGFIAKGHGGQKRAFKVKLVGEGVNDYSGPYREVFADAIREITDLDSSGNTSLGILEPTANNQAAVGEGRDLFIFAQNADKKNRFDEVSVHLKTSLSTEEQHLLTTFSSLTQRQDEISREIEESLVFLGRLVGTACRHGIPVDLPLPLGIFWKRLAEENVEPHDCIQEIDILAFKRMVGSEHSGINTDVLESTLSSQRRLLNSFAEGMSSVLPIELLSIFSGEQLRDIFCGNADIDVELLRKVAEYDGYTEEDHVITYFWDVLREMTTSERKLFLQFVWARNRLPLKESDFDAPFKIQKDNKTVGSDDDYPLPSASTCFFSLSLPEYPNKEVLKRKLIFAIENVTTMESDYVTNDVEISEGWRGL